MHKNARRIIFFLLITLILQPTSGEASSWFNTYFHQLAGVNYQRNCLLIDFAQKLRGAALSAYHRAVNHNQTDLDETIATIAQQLTEFKEWMLDLENETLNRIKKKYGISDEHWHKCLTDIATIKKNALLGMQNSHSEVSHDAAIPTDIVNIMTALLKHNNINPQSISLVMADQATIDASPHTIARTILFTESVKESQLQIHTHYIPAKIIFFPRINGASRTEKISYCAHEIQHLICQHAITDLVLGDYLTHYYSVDLKELERSTEYHDLGKVHEAQAEIFAAIKHPIIARHLKALRKTCYYPEHLYEEHFYSLSTIDMLWKVHAHIQSLITH